MKRSKIAGIVAAAAFFLAGAACEASAATYYVSGTGNDANSGMSSESAWKTVGKVNAARFFAGDRILFAGGQTFDGSLYFDSADRGTSKNPILVSSYGTGRAKISSGAAHGLFAYNTGGFVVRNLNFAGNGLHATDKSGIFFFVDLGADTKLPGIRIRYVTASGYGNSGILVGAWNKSSGYKGIRVTNARVHHNGKAGLSIYGYSAPGFAGQAHEDVYIGHVIANDNPGIAGLSRPSGSGILVGQVNHAVIERSLAYNNGARNTNADGPVGIWTYGSNDVVIQYNESHHNRTNSTGDGGGFDLDGGTTRSIIQYNYSHDNDGPGLMICQYGGAAPNVGNVIRYNVSQNDGRKNNKGGISLWNENNVMTDAEVYNNTVYMSPSGTTRPSGVSVNGGGRIVNTTIANNIVMTAGNLLSVYGSTAQDVTFIKNAYWTMGGATSYHWAGVYYPSFSAWNSKGHDSAGAQANPLFMNAGRGGTWNDADLLPKVQAYGLRIGSPFLGKGLGAFVDVSAGYDTSPPIREAQFIPDKD